MQRGKCSGGTFCHICCFPLEKEGNALFPTEFEAHKTPRRAAVVRDTDLRPRNEQWRVKQPEDWIYCQVQAFGIRADPNNSVIKAKRSHLSSGPAEPPTNELALEAKPLGERSPAALKRQSVRNGRGHRDHKQDEDEETIVLP